MPLKEFYETMAPSITYISSTPRFPNLLTESPNIVHIIVPEASPNSILIISDFTPFLFVNYLTGSTNKIRTHNVKFSIPKKSSLIFVYSSEKWLISGLMDFLFSSGIFSIGLELLFLGILELITEDDLL